VLYFIYQTIKLNRAMLSTTNYLSRRQLELSSNFSTLQIASQAQRDEIIILSKRVLNLEENLNKLSTDPLDEGNYNQ